MELVKELPEIFEEFAEQRQKSFLVMKEIKDKARIVHIFHRKLPWLWEL